MIFGRLTGSLMRVNHNSSESLNDKSLIPILWVCLHKYKVILPIIHIKVFISAALSLFVYALMGVRQDLDFSAVNCV